MARQLRLFRLVSLTLLAAHIAHAETTRQQPASSPLPSPSSTPSPAISPAAGKPELSGSHSVVAVATASPAASGTSTTSVSSAPSASPSASPAAAPDDNSLPPMPPGKQRDLGDAHWIFENVTQEERQKFKENLERWRKLTPEKRAELRDKEETRRQHMLEEINCAIDQSGLNLDRDQLQIYALRYVQERRKVEEQLRKDIEERRKNLLDQMNQRLTKEFAPLSHPTPKPSPSASPATPEVTFSPAPHGKP